MIVHFFDVLNCCNEERCQIIIYILVSCLKPEAAGIQCLECKEGRLRSDLLEVLSLYCNGGQSA